MSARVLSESALRVSDCVTELLRKQPFFGSLVLRLPLRPDATRGTLATDGYEIRYSPRWVAETASHLIETAMARVVMACALKHHTRRGDRDPERWQRASQLVTHALIRDAGFTLPPDARAWEDLSVEEAYERLSERADDDAGDDASPSPDAGAAGADTGAAEACRKTSQRSSARPEPAARHSVCANRHPCGLRPPVSARVRTVLPFTPCGMCRAHRERPTRASRIHRRWS